MGDCCDSGHYCHSTAAGVSLSKTRQENPFSLPTHLLNKMTDKFTTEINF